MNSTATGTTGRRHEDARLVTGHGRYTDDLKHAGALHVVFVRAPYASALVKSIDSVAARAYPGVAAVLTGADLDVDAFNDCPSPYRFPQGDGSIALETPRPYLVRERVRFVGEPVAMVIAASYMAAMDAAELVVIDYEEQAAVTEVYPANTPDAPQLWSDRPENLAFQWREGDMDAVTVALMSSHHVARLTSHISRVAPMPLESRSALAYIGQDGRPVLHLSHQGPHQMRDILAAIFKLEPSQLRVLAGDVGGSFGMKWGAQREEVLVFWAALRLQQPVRWTAQRSESFLSDTQARDVWVTSELGLDANGRFTALKVFYQLNVGAYMTMQSTTPIHHVGGISGVYMTPLVAAQAAGIFTNTQVTAAYRGAGRPDATYAIETVIDIAAAEMQIDPADLRRRNLIPAASMPYRTSFQFEYDCGNFEANLDKALELSQYATFPQRQALARQHGHLRGIGIAMPIEKAGALGKDYAMLRAHADGTFTLSTGTMSVGQGHETGFPRLVAQHLNVPVERIRYAQGDTDLLPEGRGNGGSSALIQGGSAVARSAEDLITKGMERASQHLETHLADIDFQDGVFRVRGTDRTVSMAELARVADAASEGTVPLAGLGQFAPPRPTFPNGCHICEVDIDMETGVVTPVHYVSVEDVGRVMNPVFVEGQIHGGVVQGISQVLMEEIRYDESGQLISGSFVDYAMPRAADMPEIVSVNLEVPTSQNPLGVKGVGEAGTVGALSATTNAVANALQQAGIRHLDMPATPMRVWQALRDAGQAQGRSA